MKTLILLHGAIGAKAQLQPLAEALSKNYDVHTLDFSGHGGLDFPADGYTMKVFADDVLRYMDEKGIDKASVFGYSMGGYVGMYIAKHSPERIEKLVTLATKYEWSEEIAERETKMLNADKIAEKLPAFATTLEERHAPQSWREVLQHTATMMRGLGADNTLKEEDYTAITTPCLVLLGDRDKMVGMDETVSVYKALPNAQLGILPNTQHPIEQVDTEQLAYFISRFV